VLPSPFKGLSFYPGSILDLAVESAFPQFEHEAFLARYRLSS
jgi:hypothetical protein